MSVIAQAGSGALDRDTAVPSTVSIYQLTVEKYHQMVNTGIISEDEPVELLKGWLVRKTRKNPRHSASTGLTREALANVLPSGWHVESHGPITTADSEPEPDISVVRGA